MDEPRAVEMVDAEPATAMHFRTARHESIRVARDQPHRRGQAWLWVVALVVGALAAFVAAPFTAYWAIRSAARYDDAAALAQLVDYDQVRAGLKPQLIDLSGVRAAPPPPNMLRDPLGAIEHLWAHRAWAPAVVAAPSPDAFLSPDGLLKVMAGRGDPRHPPTDRTIASTVKLPLPALVYFGANRVRFVVRDPADARRETVLVFARGNGWFTWRLVGIVLPAPSATA